MQSVESKLTRGHDKELINQEKNYIQSLLSQMKPEEIQDLDTRIQLIVKTNVNQSAVIEVPKKIRLMCRMIDDLL